LNGQPDPGSAPPSLARGIAGLVVANSSLLIAILVYMGWAYEDALYGYFHVRPLDLDVGIVEYIHTAQPESVQPVARICRSPAHRGHRRAGLGPRHDEVRDSRWSPGGSPRTRSRATPAASLYANAVGIGAAEDLVRGLPTRTAVAVYSIQPLALHGPGVTEQPLNRQYLYHYRYQGLRLLITRSGTYYLLPLGWSQQNGNNITYILDDSDQIRIELY
jgi:hypothetical protein